MNVQTREHAGRFSLAESMSPRQEETTQELEPAFSFHIMRSNPTRELTGRGDNQPAIQVVR